MTEFDSIQLLADPTVVTLVGSCGNWICAWWVWLLVGFGLGATVTGLIWAVWSYRLLRKSSSRRRRNDQPRTGVGSHS